ncbi:MotA/TolQ/ExbB proton channel family protein [Vibrio sp. SS-MA-C1-2]|uniref:MotA/TolQ/ExbB proton channel family protein n=1 Tax=Vibrio sp. SS-MA-C1-2 TaxID=2908646 RepID=UPI001F1804CD|nr:MotA/TolQ/ExbB proton channel family protein [Vibrio sp. SS-MA-C1-2]UJF18393.1 MotA/TolQ/ExbB proton channel family protein [Vibrio sp. SS-MA-C1-2]
MRLYSLVLILLASLFSMPSYANDNAEIAPLAKEAQQQQKQHDQQRVARFKTEEKALQSTKDRLEEQKKALDKAIAELSRQFSQNEETLADKEKQLHLETGSLGELFGVVRQSAKSLQHEISQSVASSTQQPQLMMVDEVVAAKTLPSLPQLYGLWQAFEAQIKSSGNYQNLTVPYVNGQGQITDQSVTRIGNFALLSDHGVVSWNGELASDYPKLPEDTQTQQQVQTLVSGQQAMVIDPSRGDLYRQQASKPTLAQRFEHGGIVGKIIVGLFIIGMVIAVYRFVVLAATKKKITKQLKQSDKPDKSNPLGRILSIYQDSKQKEKQLHVEALELRLLEGVMDEQQHLEQGLSMVKLIAALAPMLGLLGTVTGMIQTFQVITEFGNADPRVMAGGISMALITTVLGLTSAIPLLLFHNVLSSKVDAIRHILERQSVGLVAEQAEKQLSR